MSILDTICYITDTEVHYNDCNSLWLQGMFTTKSNHTLSRWAEMTSSCANDWDIVSEIEEYLGKNVRCWYNEMTDKIYFTNQDEVLDVNMLGVYIFFGCLILALMLGAFGSKSRNTKKRRTVDFIDSLTKIRNDEQLISLIA